MKLKELIKNEIIKGDELSVMIDLLKECEELQNCDELIIIKEPVFLDENGKRKTEDCQLRVRVFCGHTKDQL